MTRTAKAPGASHPVTVSPTGARVTVRVGGTVVAESGGALSLAEASHPVIQYIPLAGVDQSLIERIGVVFETHATAEDNEAGRATGWLPGRLPAAGRGRGPAPVRVAPPAAR